MQEYVGTKRKKATQLVQSIEHQEINQEVLPKEGSLKRYRDRIKQYRRNRAFQNNERIFYQQVGGEWTKIYQQPNERKAKLFGGNYGNGEIITEKPNIYVI